MEISTNNIGFSVKVRNAFPEGWRRSLLFLYQPIIGRRASLLFTTLYELYKMNVSVSNHNYLANIMNSSVESIIVARKELEVIGLLKTFSNKEDPGEYLYVLHEPLNVNSFTRNKVLKDKLEYKITGNLEDYLKLFFTNKNLMLHNFHNISSAPMEIDFLNEIQEKNLSLTKSLYPDKQKQKLGIISYDFLSRCIKDLFPEDNEIILANMQSQQMLNYIEKALFIYGLSYENIKEALISSYSEAEKNIDFKLLKKSLETELKQKFKYDINLESLEESKSNETSDDDGLNNMKEFSIFDYYQITFSSSPTKKIIDELTKLMKDCSFDHSIINALLDFSFFKNNKYVFNYISKIATTLKSNNYFTLKEVVSFLKSVATKNSTKKKVTLLGEDTTPSKEENKEKEGVVQDINFLQED